MKQVRLIEPETVVLEEVDKPVPEDTQVLIRVRRIGVCGSDIHAYYDKHPYISCPIVQGHEFSAEVEAVGEGVDHVTPGQRATARPQETCGQCHAGVQATYVKSIHGQKLAEGDPDAPVCIDCHGVHAIKAHDDPTATTFSTNVLQTCQRCHPDATENFPASWLSHYIPEPGEATIVWLVQLFYKILIPVVIGGMGFYVILNWVRR